MYAPGDVRCGERPDPTIVEPVGAFGCAATGWHAAVSAGVQPGIMNRRIEPGKVLDLELPLDQVAEAYRAMDERRAIKVLLRP